MNGPEPNELADELDLAAETVEDLDAHGDDVKGGVTTNRPTNVYSTCDCG